MMRRYTVIVREFEFWFESPANLEDETLRELVRAHAAVHLLSDDGPGFTVS